LDFLIADFDGLGVVVKQFAVFGAEDQVPLVRVQVAGNEMFGAERCESRVEFGGGCFVEGWDTLEMLIQSMMFVSSRV